MEQTATKPPRILSIEDDPDLQYLMSCALRAQGFEMFYAFTGPEGLEKAAAVLPDLILLDLMLPQLTGPEVLKGLTANAATRGIPVVVLTAYSGEKEFFEETLTSLGAVGYLRKPVRFNELIPLLRVIVGRGKKGVEA